MADLSTYSASPLSSESSQESLSKNKEVDVTVETAEVKPATPTTNADMLEDVPLVPDNKSLEELNQPLNNLAIERRPSRTVPRLDIRKASNAAPLPWKIDETSSPYTPTSHTRKASYAPLRVSYGGSIDGSINKLPPLSTTATSGSPYSYAPSSPYTNSSRPLSTSSQEIDLSHPPGYAQHPSTFLDRELAMPSSPSYTNHSPFYSNSSYSSSISTPLTPTRRGRGILDNDPSIYLSGEEADEDTYWDTAAKWAKFAGKRLSAGEQTIWKMVNLMGSGDDRP